EVFGWHSYPQAGNVAGELRFVVGHRSVHRGRIQRIVAGNCLKQDSGIAGGAGQWAYLIQGGSKRYQTKARDSTNSRLERDCIGKRTRLAHRATGVGTERRHGFSRAHCGGRASTTASRDSLQVPGVTSGKECRIFSGGAHGEFV